MSVVKIPPYRRNANGSRAREHRSIPSMGDGICDCRSDRLTPAQKSAALIDHRATGSQLAYDLCGHRNHRRSISQRRRRAHGLNERIRVRSLMNGRRFLYEVVKLYANGAD
jgi:hypothetical protein